jgi:hypothetical protein
MVLAIFKKNRPKDKWNLHSFPKTNEDAIKASKFLKEFAFKLGYNEAEIIIQSFNGGQDSVPQTLEDIKVKPEKLNYN